MTNRELFPMKLKTYMDMARVNQTELADAVGVSKSTVHCWLTGKAFPRIDVIQKIADTLGCKTDDLLVKSTASLMAGAGGIRMPNVPAGSPAFHAIAARVAEYNAAKNHPLLPPDDEEFIQLWSRATPTAKQAALAVLKAMDNVNE